MVVALAAACASEGTTSLAPEIDYKLHRPTVPIPDSLWKAPAGSTPARGSYVYLEMDPSLAAGDHLHVSEEENAGAGMPDSAAAITTRRQDP